MKAHAYFVFLQLVVIELGTRTGQTDRQTGEARNTSW